MRDGDLQNGFRYGFGAGGFLSVLAHFGDLYFMTLSEGAGSYGVHLPHDIPQFIHLSVIQRSHLRAVFRTGHLGREYGKDIFPVDGKHAIVGGDLLPVVGGGILDFLNVRLKFSVEGGDCLRYTGAGTCGIRTEEQPEAGTDDQGDQTNQQNDYHSDPAPGCDGGNQSFHRRNGRFDRRHGYTGCRLDSCYGSSRSGPRRLRRFLCGFRRRLGGLLCRFCRPLGSFDAFRAVFHAFHGTAGGFHCLLRFSLNPFYGSVFGSDFRGSILNRFSGLTPGAFGFLEGTGNFFFSLTFRAVVCTSFFPPR